MESKILKNTKVDLTILEYEREIDRDCTVNVILHTFLIVDNIQHEGYRMSSVPDR